MLTGPPKPQTIDLWFGQPLAPDDHRGRLERLIDRRNQARFFLAYLEKRKSLTSVEDGETGSRFRVETRPTLGMFLVRVSLKLRAQLSLGWEAVYKAAREIRRENRELSICAADRHIAASMLAVCLALLGVIAVEVAGLADHELPPRVLSAGGWFGSYPPLI